MFYFSPSLWLQCLQQCAVFYYHYCAKISYPCTELKSNCTTKPNNFYIIRPGKLDYLFLIRKNLDVHEGRGHFSLFIIKQNAPNQAICC